MEDVGIPLLRFMQATVASVRCLLELEARQRSQPDSHTRGEDRLGQCDLV
jgi:hypothetical protein